MWVMKLAQKLMDNGIEVMLDMGNSGLATTSPDSWSAG